MVELDANVDALPRKKLQALAKSFGIKANQKSAILRQELREALAFSRHEENKTDNERERLNVESRTSTTSTKEETFKDTIDELVEATKQQNRVEGAPLLETKIECFSLEQNISTGNFSEDKARSRVEEIKVNENLQEQAVGGVELTQDQSDFNNSEKAEKKNSNSVSTKSGHNVNTLTDNGVEYIQDTVSILQNRTKTTIQSVEDANAEGDAIFVERKIDRKGYRRGKEIDIKQGLLSNEKLLNDDNGEVLPTTKLPSRTKKSSVNVKVEKFPSKLEKLNRSNTERLKQSTKESNKLQREVPLWKIHSTDFLRREGTEKNRFSQSLERRPFGNRSNGNLEVITKNFKGNQKSIRNVTAQKLPMSKRNEEQMKKFLERQSMGRQERAKRERIKLYANCVRK